MFVLVLLGVGSALGASVAVGHSGSHMARSVIGRSTGGTLSIVPKSSGVESQADAIDASTIRRGKPFPVYSEQFQVSACVCSSCSVNPPCLTDTAVGLPRCGPPLEFEYIFRLRVRCAPLSRVPCSTPYAVHLPMHHSTAAPSPLRVVPHVVPPPRRVLNTLCRSRQSNRILHTEQSSGRRSCKTSLPGDLGWSRTVLSSKGTSRRSGQSCEVHAHIGVVCRAWVVL